MIEARVLVTDRFTPLQIGGRTVHQIGMPFHWGNGTTSITTGDSANDLLGIVLDANTHIQDSKARRSTSVPAGVPRARRAWSSCVSTSAVRA